jgi:hypothetical protein
VLTPCGRPGFCNEALALFIGRQEAYDRFFSLYFLSKKRNLSDIPLSK